MKRLIAILLVLVVGWLGVIFFIVFMFSGGPDAVLRLIENDSSMFEMDMEPDLVRNENGEVIEFTGYSETDAVT